MKEEEEKKKMNIYKKCNKPRKKKDKKNIYHHENKPFYHTDAWKYVRSRVLERENACCQRCGQSFFDRRSHVHYVIPIKEDSTLKLEGNNLRLLCPGCHAIEENEDKPKEVFPSYFNR
ncbi:HNH endonuclease [Bacillus sp. TE9106W]